MVQKACLIKGCRDPVLWGGPQATPSVPDPSIAHLASAEYYQKTTWKNTMTRMPRITGNKRNAKTMAVHMRLSSQMLPRRRSPRENEKPLSLKDETKRTRRRRRRRRGRRPSRVEGEKGAKCLPATGKSEIKRIMTICAGQEDQETSRTCETSRTADNRTTDGAMKRSLQRKGGNRHEDSGRAQAIAASYKSIP